MIATLAVLGTLLIIFGALIAPQIEKQIQLIVAVLLICTGSMIVGFIFGVTKEKEQPKYKQEIVYSLKDGKYLPTDTLYTEIK